LSASGQILWQGQNLLKRNENALCNLRGRDIRMVFQEPMTALNPLQTIGAQVSEGIRLHTRCSRRQAKAQALDVLTQVGLPPERVSPERYPHELSGGQRQRVVIAMAVALNPKLLIADEPTTALDVTTQAQIRDLLLDLARSRGMGLLMITHDLALVSQMADRIVLMRHGAIVEQAPTHQLITDKRHDYTRALFAASKHQPKLPAAAPGAPLLQVQGARCEYPLPRAHPFAKPKRFTAVKDVSFTLHAGERLGLVGESGCGKSTLTRAILGLAPLAGGQILFDGQPVFDKGRVNPQMQRAVQVVFQDPYGSFNPRHRVSRLIAEPFHLLDNPPTGQARRDAVEEALIAVGLRPEDADKYIHAFSGGQRQRIAIARALIIRPKLIVFDEAVSALDVQVRAQILDLMAQLSRDYGLAYLFISHDLTVVRGITDKVLVMREGKILEEGATAQVLTLPRHTYTRSLIDAAPVLP
jgi:peptide/nickel transport system ATP-binding protein